MSGDGIWPVDDDPERSLIGAMLLDARIIPDVVATGVSGDRFRDPHVGELFELIASMQGAGEVVDFVTVSARMPSLHLPFDSASVGAWVSATTTSYAGVQYAQIVLERAVRRAVALEGARMTQEAMTAPDPLRLAQEGAQRLLKSVETARSPLGRPKPIVEVMRGPKGYDWIIEGLLERRDRLVITGQEGHGKTTLMRQIAVTAAAGLHPFTGDAIKPVTVLVLDAENTEIQWRRNVDDMLRKAMSLGPANPLDRLFLNCMPRIDLTSHRDLADVHRMLDDVSETGLLVIGPLYRLIPRAINSDDDAAPLLAALDTFRDKGWTLAIEAHAGHATTGSGARDMRPRGSSALLGWPEFGLGMRERSGKNPDRLYDVLRWRGDRDEGRTWPHTLRRGAKPFPWAEEPE